MDCSTTSVPTNFIHDSSGQDSSDDDDVPLSKMLKKPQNDDKQLRGSTHGPTPSSNSNSGKDKSGLDDTSDDEPLIKMKTKPLPAKKPERKENNSGSSNDPSGHDSSDDDDDDDVPLGKLLKKPKDEEPQSEKTECPALSSKPALTKDDGSDATSGEEPSTKKRNASPANESKTNKIRKTSSKGRPRNKKTEVSDLEKDDSSDEEPLIKMAKVSSKAAKKAVSPPSERSDDTDGKVDDDAGSDYEPLSKVAKRRKSQKTKASRKETPVKKSKRKAARKKVHYVETSSVSSDDEPLMKKKRRRTRGLSEETGSTNSRTTRPKPTNKSLKEPSSSDDSSDDYVPLASLMSKRGKPERKSTEKTKKKAASRTSMARKKRVSSDESSDDEPLINLVKKTPTARSTPKKRSTTPKKKAPASTSRTAASAKKQPRKTKGTKGSSSDSSDAEPLIKAAKTPQMDKILRVILERCDVEETQPAGRLNETSADEIPVDEEMKTADSEVPDESAEESISEEA